MELVTDEDVDMDWDEEPVITINQDETMEGGRRVHQMPGSEPPGHLD
jgi:hypothetical protein